MKVYKCNFSYNSIDKDLYSSVIVVTESIGQAVTAAVAHIKNAVFNTGEMPDCYPVTTSDALLLSENLVSVVNQTDLYETVIISH